MQRQDESSNRRQWVRPVLKQLRVTSDTDSGTVNTADGWEGGCPPSHPTGGIGDNYAIYRAPTSSEVGQFTPTCS